MPMILNRDAMYNRLTFRNNDRDRKKSDEVDEIDNKFAKLRFGEYLHGLDQILKNRMGKQHHRAGKKSKKTQLAKKVATNGATTNVRAKDDKPVNNSHVEHHLTDNDIDSSFSTPKKHSVGRNVGVKHRNRTGLNKQRRNRKQPQKVAGLGLNEIKNFRNQVPRNHRKTTLFTKIVSSIATTTTVAPQS